ncbi:MAG: asparagine synthase (glutamine-hydrolyzing) [Bacteroidota bacterium]|nr:asparagine synthase (glutamine-hydrolyzing) [Bacteroidota bacterium]
MCGIVGILQHNSAKQSQESFIQWALETMHHRGPDSNGYWQNDVYATGFVRLAIRDLTHHGDQPMHSSCGRYVLSFNGEIYNSDIFKEALLKDGVYFNSTSDTEVLLYSLRKWTAQELLPKLNGMFAFAFFDKQEHRLLLARDRVGIKPLYIGWSSDGIVYSSQYDHIINHSFCAAETLDVNAMALYLQLGYVPEGAGIIKNTMLLPHGHYAEITCGEKLAIQKYYTYPYQQEEASVKNLDETLRKSVVRQLVSDVPVGTFMSGGVDSTLVTSYAVQHQSHIQSFTIGVEDKVMDESDAAQAFADIFGTTHHCKFIRETDILNIIDKNFKAYTEPFADFSSLPTLLLSEMARQHVTVALSGDGGDELFWGYPRNKKIIQAAQPYRYNLLIRNLLFAKEKITSAKKRTVLKRHLLTHDYIHHYYKSIFINGAETWLPQLMNGEVGDPYFLSEVSSAVSDLDDASLLMNKIRKIETDLHLQRILLKVDRASMYNSLEVRVPLLDNDVINYSTSITYTDCIVHDQGKYNLKQLLSSKTNPSLVFQPKKGFTVPLASWIRNQLKEEITTTVLNMPLHLLQFFNRKTLEQMIVLHMRGEQDNSWILWAIYALIKWDSLHRNKFKKPA